MRVEGSGPTATSDNIRSIATFQGSVYVANFDHGVERIEGNRRTLVWPPLNSEAASDPRARQVLSLHADNPPKGPVEKLWIGTAEAGVFSFDGK